MAKQTSNKKKLPVKLPSVPDSESGPTKYNEPDLPVAVDRVPTGKFRFGDTRADLRLRIEQLLQSKEAVPENRWTELSPDTPSLLVEMLNDDAVLSREAIFHRLITVLGQLSVKRAIGRLSAILADTKAKPVTRAYAANALGRIGDPAAIEALITTANEKDDMIRRQVTMALGRIDNEAVVPHLLKLRNDKSVAVSEVAAEALGRWESKGRRLPTGKRPTNLKNKTKPDTRKKSPAEDRQ